MSKWKDLLRDMSAAELMRMLELPIPESGHTDEERAMVMASAERWMSRDLWPMSRAYVQTLLDAEDYGELSQHFGPRLGFGTAGIRGRYGAGPRRVNALALRELAAALVAWLAASETRTRRPGTEPEPGFRPDFRVVLAFDARHHGERLARSMGAVFLSLDVDVVIAPVPMPTPMCAHAARYYEADLAVMVTASHNPPEYSGVKLFDHDGIQLSTRAEVEIMDHLRDAILAPLPDIADDAADSAAEFAYFDEELEASYEADLRALYAGTDRTGREDLVIAYTALQGVGFLPMSKALKDAGFEVPRIVEDEIVPDPYFDVAHNPNPELPETLKNLLSVGRRCGADVCFANDPDVDRLAVALPDPEAPGNLRVLTGNQIGLLLADHLFARARATGASMDSVAVGTSIVSTRSIHELAAAHGAASYDTLTGFKYLGREKLRRQAELKQDTLLLFEEALGFGIGPYFYDKDGVSAGVIMAIMVCDAKRAGTSLWQRLDDISQQIGLYVSTQRSIALPANEPGAQRMAELRQALPADLCGIPVRSWTDLLSGGTSPQGDPLPPADLLIAVLDDGMRVALRPSGTEPKIKCYYEAREPRDQSAWHLQERRASAKLDSFADAHVGSLL